MAPVPFPPKLLVFALKGVDGGGGKGREISSWCDVELLRLRLRRRTVMVPSSKLDMDVA